jgi:hypothetical protein
MAKAPPHPGRRGPQATAPRHPGCRRTQAALCHRETGRRKQPRGPHTKRACWIFEVCPTISFAFEIPFGIADAPVEVRATPPSAASATTAILSVMDISFLRLDRSLLRLQNVLPVQRLQKKPERTLSTLSFLQQQFAAMRTKKKDTHGDRF